MFQTLLVEDDNDFRGMLRGLLVSRFPSISVFEAGDGESALRLVSESPPDLVLLDVKLPGLNGLDVTKKIKDMNADIVVVILSGYDFLEYRQQAFRNGADCFIYKGSVSSTNDVLAKVEGTMKRKPQRSVCQGQSALSED